MLKIKEFINRFKLAMKIILGYNIIVYETGTKIVIATINNNFDVMNIKYDYAVDKGNTFKDNNGEIRYWGNK